MTDILVTRHFRNREDKEPTTFSFRVLSQEKEMYFDGRLKDAKKELLKTLYDNGFDINSVKYFEGVEKYDC